MMTSADSAPVAPPTTSPDPTSPGTATIALIAAEAGVSIPTVSKVLNGRTDVAAVTRARVEAVIDRYQYRRRRGRAQTGPGLLDLVVHELDAAGPCRSSRASSRWRARSAWGSCSPSWAARTGRARSGSTTCWLVGRAASSSCCPTSTTRSAASWRPGRSRSSSSTPRVSRPAGVPDGRLRQLGGWSGGDPAPARARAPQGRRRLRAGGRAVQPRPDRRLPHGARRGRSGRRPVARAVRRLLRRRGYTHGMDLLDRPDRPTAIFAGSDFQALGVMRAARELELRIPEDLSIVGYDDLPVTEWIGPPLTTIHQPLQEMAATATRMVLALARGEVPANPRIDLATELVIRESTAPPRSPDPHGSHRPHHPHRALDLAPSGPLRALQRTNSARNPRTREGRGRARPPPAPPARSCLRPTSCAATHELGVNPRTREGGGRRRGGRWRPAGGLGGWSSGAGGGTASAGGAVDGVLVDRGDLLGVSGRGGQGGHVVLELGHGAGADQRRGDPVVAQDPRQGELREGLTARRPRSRSAPAPGTGTSRTAPTA